MAEPDSDAEARRVQFVTPAQVTALQTASPKSRHLALASSSPKEDSTPAAYPTARESLFGVHVHPQCAHDPPQSTSVSSPLRCPSEQVPVASGEMDMLSMYGPLAPPAFSMRTVLKPATNDTPWIVVLRNLE